MKKYVKVVSILMMLCMLCLDGKSCADDLSGEENKKNEGTEYSDGIPGPIKKSERGIGNILLGWTEIPKQVLDNSVKNGPFKGFILDIFKGTFKALARTASGAADLATFPVGRYDKPVISPDIPQRIKP